MNDPADFIRRLTGQPNQAELDAREALRKLTGTSEGPIKKGARQMTGGPQPAKKAAAALKKGAKQAATGKVSGPANPVRKPRHHSANDEG
jgi:hypothetical protein